eukprot:CAMPEP_0168393670 /NCGR_PEP_ID=MMETSP0228-20121227/19138_1 /TAXON_ID=133427 /ORGANISM="Protoceratium reticulatum, Strain CCCM 535 (=CCMP 1889)" /LENGTH=105 /DNA_ID=CAMNT_0008407059 /DNA_START=134 /DNA_END=447 /DNA_ORIENTATION=-
MASTVVAYTAAEFEFNPMAPEFIPELQQQQLMFLPGLPVPSAFLQAGAGLGRKNPTRIRDWGAGAAAPALAAGTAADQEQPAPRLLLVPREEVRQASTGRRRPGG